LLQLSEGLPPGEERILIVAEPKQSPKQLLSVTIGGEMEILD
jgi:hypothetical protein